MLDTTKVKKLLMEARTHAKANNLANNLQQKLDYLENYGGSEKTQCRLFPDFAPWSFQFTMCKLNPQGEWTYWFNGGLIYHGSHDGHGSGAAPTFSVTILSTTGWSIHT